ncbi:alpha/beta fold hydrolase [Arthrobacter sp. NPDC093128]|uniref:esterase/lipase family protein n=1 Tax=Arthrobacter sp. NPDC093128 TaxID=3154979 RepID=UPI00343AA669
MKKLLSVLLPLLLLVTLPAPSAYAQDEASTQHECSHAQPSPLPTRISGRPVIYVHGWLGSSSGHENGPELLEEGLEPGYEVFAFDYSFANTVWGASGEAASCLADYIRQVSAAMTGGDGKVLAVGHSMGGIVIRAAGGILAGSGQGSILGGVVSLGTPYSGSPWGGTVYAEMLQNMRSTGIDPVKVGMPEAETSAAVCLAVPLPNNCAPLPYLPGSTKYAMVGSQIIIERRLFGLKFMSADIPLFGDAIVPKLSATGYVNTSAGTRPSGKFWGETIVECKHTAGYLSQQLLRTRSIAGTAASLIGTTIEALGDQRALDMMREGKADVSQMPLLVYGLFSDCFHIALPDNEDAMTAVVGYLKKMEPPITATDGSGGTADDGQSLGDLSALTGLWRGPVYGSQDGYDLVLELTHKNGTLSGTVDYPQLACSGTWTQTDRTGMTVRFEEQILKDESGRCVRRLDATLTRTATGLHVRIKRFWAVIEADLVRR